MSYKQQLQPIISGEYQMIFNFKLPFSKSMKRLNFIVHHKFIQYRKKEKCVKSDISLIWFFLLDGLKEYKYDKKYLDYGIYIYQLLFNNILKKLIYW